jgi:hypothetical protein
MADGEREDQVPPSADPAEGHAAVSPSTGRVAARTAVFAAAALGFGLTTPPRSGPHCARPCITYPYTDAAAFVPRDYLWMYPATLTALGAVALMACILHDAGRPRRTWGQIALGLATVAAAALTIDYAIQLAAVQPSMLAGQTRDLSLVSMYNPHGIFLALEDLGYLLMAVSFLFAGLAIARRARFGSAVRWILLISGIVVAAALLVLGLWYGRQLDDRFEVVTIGIDWAVLMVAGVLLGLSSGRARRRSAGPAHASASSRSPART